MPVPNHEDRQLSQADVQRLDSADALAQFFGMLGYPEGTRLPMTAAALGLNQSLTDATRRIERLVSVEGALEIYLVELTSVTVAHTRALVRAFRDRGADFLFVLTDDYRRLDFVLLDREVRLDAPTTLARPRVLTVDRTKPDPVALRVLRRFTFTEVDEDGDLDPIAQFEKLKSAYTIAEWSEPLFNNRALFSDYYLIERLPELEAWHAPERNQAFRAIRRILAPTRQRLRDDATAAPDALIRPVLQTLGFDVTSGKGGTEADLLLRTSPAAGGEAVAFALTYPWHRYLDGKDAKDPVRPEENPGAQVVSLLDQEVAPWAIVTNGKTWRLYSARAHSRATNYYEVDLEEILALADPGEAFRYFYLLFRAAAFSPSLPPSALSASPLPPGEGQGEGLPLSFLDWLMDESTAYARELGERLKARVFEEIFPHFARGFVEGLGGPDVLVKLPDAQREARLQTLFDATLTFLYRLLFLLYAESRDLLPVREMRGYRRISLRQLKETIAEKAGPIEELVPERLTAAYSADSTTLYDALLTLFDVIAEGRAAYNVPTYNGGLFQMKPDGGHQNGGHQSGDDESRDGGHQNGGHQNGGHQNGDDESRDSATSRFLLETKMPDRYLALGLDRLTRDIDPKRGDLGFIDYKSLGVRQLGSIYEGLLEFKVRVAPETMAVVAGAKTEEVVPLAEARRTKRKLLTEGRGKSATPRTLERGTVYLENDRRERKATGSYYTPDYIVKYIVRHTVGPVMDEKLDALRPRLEDAGRRYCATEKRKLEMEKVKPDALNRPALLQDVAADVLRDLFDIKVLDPAMGSGHFLVEAVDYVTDRLVQFLDGFPFLATFFEGMRASILDELRRQEVTVDPAKLTDVTLLKRHVLKRCIYGVDLNPMAVELAKVSLWLDCFTLGAPLSFLDHHLRCGNSLIGAMAQDVAEEMAGPQGAGQMTFLTGPFVGLLRAAEIMRGISTITDVTLEQVQESSNLFKAFDRAAKPYKQLLDIYVAQHFGVKRAAEFLKLYGVDALQADDEKLGKPYREAIAEARALYEEKHLFHWDLEFPEVFIDLARATWARNAGFDAVIGNPPYDELSEHELGRAISEKDYLQQVDRYSPVQESSGRLNWYHFFMVLGIKLLQINGRYGYIVPMSWMGDSFTSGVRHWLLHNHRPVLIECFPQKDDPKRRVFPDAKLPTSVFVAVRERTDGDIKVRVHPGRDILSHPHYKASISVLERLNSDTVMIPVVSRVGWSLLEKVATSQHLGRLDEYGAEPTSGEIIFNASTRPYLTEEWKPGYNLVLRGGHIQRYELLEESRQGTPTFLKTADYLSDSQPDSKAFDHRKPRVVYQEGSAIDAWRRVVPTFLPAGNICGHKVCYFVNYKVSPYALLAVFASELFNWLVESLSVTNSLPAYLIGGLPFPKFPRTDGLQDNRYKNGLTRLYDGAQYQDLLAQTQKTLGRDANGDLAAFNPDSEERSRTVHDLLAHLAEQMIAMHKQKQTAVDAFWTDLAAATDPGSFDALRNKGKWAQSLAKDPVCAPYVDAGSRATRTLDESLGWDEACFEAFVGQLVGRSAVTPALGRVYRAHAEGYRALVQRIAETDGLIDQVVYCLYGLTEEEIAVVEGNV